MTAPRRPWIALDAEEGQLAYGALQELKHRAREEGDSPPLTEEEERLRLRLGRTLGHEQEAQTSR